MPRLLQILTVVLMVLAARPAGAFSLLGNFEAWQVPALGYNPPGAADIGAPKNLGEEYRWNVPVITYGFDNAFINYFGNEGVAAVDAAFAILNSLPDLSTLSQALTEYPLVDPRSGGNTTFRDARRVNLRAQADSIVDMKSVTLGGLIEILGLASPERWVWAVRDRKTPPNATNYLTIMRNFDPTTYEPSKYVNGNRYTYEIVEFTDPGAYTDAIERPVDPLHSILGPSAVASISGGLFQSGLDAGVFYTYLTRDDIGGLRYLYDTNNLNWEPFPPGTQIFETDFTTLVSITNEDLTLLSLRGLRSSPAQMSNFYPGIIIREATPGVITTVSNFPIVSTQTVVIPFITNFSQQIVVSNIDLRSFSSFALTNNPAALLAAFPDLVITSTNTFPTSEVQVASIVLTNAPKQPWDDPFVTNMVFQTNYVTNLAIRFLYTFRNVITNYASPITLVRRVTTGLDKEPWSDALNPVYKTRIEDFVETIPSGGIIIVPTNLVGYVFTGFNVTNVLVSSNVIFATNFVDSLGLARSVSQTELRFFTNVQYSAYPIEFVPGGILTNILVTNAVVTTNVITYKFSFANVITNYSAPPPTFAAQTTYEVVRSPANPAILVTNVLRVETIPLPVSSGGFLIDTNQTGFAFSGIPPTTTLIPVTNVVFDVTDPITGRRLVQEYVYSFLQSTYLVFPFTLQPAPASVLRPGIGKLRFQRIGGGTFTGNAFQFTNRFTASFFTNGILRTNAFQVVQTRPDILISAADLGTFANSVAPIQWGRNNTMVNNAALNSTDPNQGGPGTITSSTIIFNKVGPSLINSFPGFMTEAASISFGFRPFVWGSFDGSTNAPIVFPKDITLEQIELLITGGSVP